MYNAMILPFVQCHDTSPSQQKACSLLSHVGIAAVRHNRTHFFSLSVNNVTKIEVLTSIIQ